MAYGNEGGDGTKAGEHARLNRKSNLWRRNEPR